MLIKHTEKMVRTAQLDERLVELSGKPQTWQFKSFRDAAGYGIELLWPYQETLISRARKPYPPLEFYSRLTDGIFGVIFPGFLQVPENHNLLIIPHHTQSVAHDHCPRPLTQMIEFDWWPLSPQIMFEVPSKPRFFRENKPFAQAIAVPRQEYAVLEMDEAEKKEKEAASKYIKDHRDEFCTRKIVNEDFPDQDNVYERLTQLQRMGSLPSQIKNQNKKPRRRMGWK